MNDISVAFTDFWPAFDVKDNFILSALREKFNVSVVDVSEKPDILFYSFFGTRNLNYPAPVRVYFTGENDVPDFNLCDYAMSFHNIDFGGRHLRLPLYVLYPEFDALCKGTVVLPDSPYERDFCSMVVSNMKNSDNARRDFFYGLSEYRQVASGGRFANNVGGRVADKMAFISKYRFNIAFENSSVPGYTTEKIIEAFAAGSVPLYWGDPLIAKEFNPGAFVNIMDFGSIDDAVRYVAELDKDKERYLEFFDHNPLLNNPYINWKERVAEFLTSIAGSMKRCRVDSGAIGSLFRRRVSRENTYDIVTMKRPFEKLSGLFNIHSRAGSKKS